MVNVRVFIKKQITKSFFKEIFWPVESNSQRLKSAAFEMQLSQGVWGSMVSALIIIGGLNLKICQNFVGTKFFLKFVGGDNYMGGVIFITTFSLFHFFRNIQTPRKVKSFF